MWQGILNFFIANALMRQTVTHAGTFLRQSEREREREKYRERRKWWRQRERRNYCKGRSIAALCVGNKRQRPPEVLAGNHLIVHREATSTIPIQ